jgi:gamma-glutamyltranspeptidase
MRTVGSNTTGWAVATPHAEANEAGYRALREGGNAVDAAVAAAAALAVVYPHMCSIGGDLLALARNPSGEVTALNSSGAAPLGIDALGLVGGRQAMPLTGPLTVTVPGAVAGWDALLAWGGRRSLAQALEAAIVLADKGVPSPRSLAADLATHAHALVADDGMSGVLFAGGRPLGEGELLRQPALATSLVILARDGSAAMYGGELGARLAGGLRNWAPRSRWPT